MQTAWYDIFKNELANMYERGGRDARLAAMEHGSRDIPSLKEEHIKAAMKRLEANKVVINVAIDVS